MSYNVLTIIWYILISILWIGFLTLESLTSGVGIFFKSAKTQIEGKQLQLTVGPYWDGSEVWFITAGGATFAAFPIVYAEMFSSLYTAIFLILIMLIGRGVALEMVYRDENKTWQNVMGWVWTISSYGLPFLLGVRFVNLFYKANTMEVMSTSFLSLLSKVGILGGILFISFYAVSGVFWANIKAEGEITDRLKPKALVPSVIVALIIPILMMAFNWDSNLFAINYVNYPILWILPVILMILPFLTIYAACKGRIILGFVSNILSIAMFMIVGFVGIFPYMIPGVTAYDGRASELTLKIMAIVAAIFVPLILAYQGWKFYRFRKKIDSKYVS